MSETHCTCGDKYAGFGPTGSSGVDPSANTTDSTCPIHGMYPQPAPQASEGLRERIAKEFTWIPNSMLRDEIAAFVAAEMTPLRALVEKWRKVNCDQDIHFVEKCPTCMAYSERADELAAALDRMIK